MKLIPAPALKMTTSILPAFVRHPEEAKIIGRLLAGYGELEFDLAKCVGLVLADHTVAFRLLFRTRGEEQRIQSADAVLRPKLKAIGLVDAWNRTYGAMKWCRRTRNQYAHCYWFADESGLYFFQLEKSAKTASGDLHFTFHPIDVPLLEQQEAHFRYAADALLYLQSEWDVRHGSLRYPKK